MLNTTLKYNFSDKRTRKKQEKKKIKLTRRGHKKSDSPA